jgi:DNA topoisomerase VI subunit A
VTLNKRAVYYTLLRHLNSTADLDEILTNCCYILGVTRKSLGIVASPKGLIAGEISQRLEIDQLQIPANYKKLGSFGSVQTVVVVEKETLF